MHVALQRDGEHGHLRSLSLLFDLNTDRRGRCCDPTLTIRWRQQFSSISVSLKQGYCKMYRWSITTECSLSLNKRKPGRDNNSLESWLNEKSCESSDKTKKKKVLKMAKTSQKYGRSNLT